MASNSAVRHGYWMPIIYYAPHTTSATNVGRPIGWRWVWL